MDRIRPCEPVQGERWDSLPTFLRSLCAPATTALSDGDEDWMRDPEKVDYVEKLIEALYEARAIVASYNVVLVVVLFVLAFLHWRETTRNRAKWQRLRRFGSEKPPSTVSSSNSTLTGTATPPDAPKDLDIERVPLLSGSASNTNKPRKTTLLARAARSWLERQPPALPVIDRALPSNGTSLLVLAWLALNVSLHVYRLPLRRDFFFIFADRAGCVFVVNLPLLYLLGAKNQPLRRLTGRSYEALNLFHRRVGELLCFEGALHFASMLLWQFALGPRWLLASVPTARAYFTHPVILFGIAALASYEALYFTSLASFRQRWYELFLASHVLLQAAALVFLWLHYPTSQPYVALSLLIFLADRLVWRLCLKRADMTADITVLDDDTYLLSANWDVPRRPPSWSFRGRGSVLYGWDPTDHVFLTVPALGRTHALQAHPFTIASAAPGRPRQSPAAAAPHAWFTLLIRAHAGFTRDLLQHAIAHEQPAARPTSASSAPGPPPPGSRRVAVRLDGPYGSPHALAMLRASGCAVLVAGGSGIAVAFPLVWALLHERDPADDGEEGNDDDSAEEEPEVAMAAHGTAARRKRKVRLLWVTHSREHRAWVPAARLDELVTQGGLELVVPEPTAEAGRPDVRGIVDGWIEEAADEGREVGVLVSGPDGLNRAVRNACADAIGRGGEVQVAVEKFGW